MLKKLMVRKMHPTEVERLVHEVTIPLRDLNGLETIILFGSALEVGFSEASDLDFLLIFETREMARAGRKEVYRLHSGKARSSRNINPLLENQRRTDQILRQKIRIFSFGCSCGRREKCD